MNDNEAIHKLSVITKTVAAISLVMGIGVIVFINLGYLHWIYYTTSFLCLMFSGMTAMINWVTYWRWEFYVRGWYGFSDESVTWEMFMEARRKVKNETLENH